MKKKVNWALVGTGGIAMKMVKDMARVPGAVPYALVSRDSQRAKHQARIFGVPHWETNLGTLLSNHPIDAVYIATPHSAHLEPALVALDHGIPVLCEKPLTPGYHSSRQLVHSAREHGVLLMEALWSKFHPLLRRVWDFIDQGHLGQVRSMGLNFGFKAEFHGDSRLFNSKLGGGATLDIGIYPLWLPLAFWGEPREIQTLGTRALTGVDEASITNLKFSSGAIAHCESSFVYPMDNAAHIYGTKGRIEIPNPWYAPKRAHFYPLQGRQQTWIHRAHTVGLNYQVEHFQNLMIGGLTESPIHSLDDTLLLAKVMDRIMAQI